MNNDQIPSAWDPAGTPKPSHANPPHRILVVDDDKDIRRLNADVLVRFGYQVDTAADGEEGWTALHAVSHAPDSYHLLITDHDMPGLSGLDLVKRLRAVHIALPVIMTTGKLPKSEFNQHSWLQPAAILLKPYTIAELLGAVKEAMRPTEQAPMHIAPPPNWRSRPSADGFPS